MLKPQFSGGFAVFGAITGYAIFAKHKTFRKSLSKNLEKKKKMHKLAKGLHYLVFIRAPPKVPYKNFEN